MYLGITVGLEKVNVAEEGMEYVCLTGEQDDISIDTKHKSLIIVILLTVESYNGRACVIKLYK